MSKENPASLEFGRILKCRDENGEVTLITRRHLEAHVNQGTGLVIRAVFAEEEGELDGREVVYTGEASFN